MTNGKIDPADYGFPAGLSQPALRALVGAGYTSVEQVSAATPKELLALHGLGPKAIRLFREAGVTLAGEAAVAAEPVDEATAERPGPDAGEEGETGSHAAGAVFAVDAIAEVATVEGPGAAEQMLASAERGLPDFGTGAGGPMDAGALVQAWRDAGDTPGVSWVVFEHGTRVTVAEPEGDPAERAAALLGEHGAIQFGTSSADFAVITPEHGRGWIVTGHRPEIATYVSREEADPYTDAITIGLMGRSKRGRDAERLRVIHVEDRRAG